MRFLVNSIEIEILPYKFYPNPVQDKVYINGIGDANCTLWSLCDQLIQKGTVMEGLIDIANQPSGSYIF